MEGGACRRLVAEPPLPPGSQGLARHAFPRRASMAGTGGTLSARSAESWLGDLDSNQGCPVQSREFYR
jgi:hypothetical protein